jgi:hypothetical protein
MHLSVKQEAFYGQTHGSNESSSLIALMMEAATTSETLVYFYKTSRCYNPEDSHLNFYLVLLIIYFNIG